MREGGFEPPNPLRDKLFPASRKPQQLAARRLKLARLARLRYPRNYGAAKTFNATGIAKLQTPASVFELRLHGVSARPKPQQLAARRPNHE